MKKLIFLLILPIAIASCSLDGESYTHYTDFVDIDTTLISETALVGDTVNIYSRAIAYNGCWSNLEVHFLKYNDTLYLIDASGNFESYDGICPEILVMRDSIFHFRPDSSGTYIFVSQSRNKVAIFDTLIVTSPTTN